MKKSLFTLILFLCVLNVFSSEAQKRRIDRIQTIVQIWGGSYLFHSVVVPSDQLVAWEKPLVCFLPLLTDSLSDDVSFNLLNDSLLAILKDPLTRVQRSGEGRSNQIQREKFVLANSTY